MKQLLVVGCRLLGQAYGILHKGTKQLNHKSGIRIHKFLLAICSLLFTLFAAPAAVHAYTNFECDAQFCVKTTELAADTTFNFTMSAKGDFTVDWGDGRAVQTITRTNTTDTTYSHTYATAGTYVIKFNGTTTGYNTRYSSPIGFTNNTFVGQIEGSLSSIFPTMTAIATKVNQPTFFSTFSGCTNMTGSIPENLFAGISGKPTSMMFADTFRNCSGLSGSIPDGLFSGISGAPASSMFSQTFLDCSGLTGSIPENLFAGISGAPASSMFQSTFMNCSGLTGLIPDGLFGNLTGAPANAMFYRTLYNCNGLTGSIPDGLFGNLSGAPASSMFMETFNGCSGLTGSIPDGLFGNLTGAPANQMFYYTFSGCSGLTGSIPDGLFGNLSGAPASYMFYRTFSGCSNLSGYVPSSMYSGITSVSGSAMRYVFNGSGLSTTCPCGMEQVITGWESHWNGKVACSGTENVNQVRYNGVCAEYCPFMQNIPMGNGKTFPVFATRVTTPSMEIKGGNNQTCYVPVETGAGTTGDMPVTNNGTTYHTGTM